MRTTRSLLAEAADALAGSSGRREAELLLAHVLRRSRAWLYAHADDAHADEIGQRFRALVARRAKGEPVAYLTGHRQFWSLDLAVTPDVLIPRPETELLVELALERLVREEETHVADLGTGSGAVALAIAHELPSARVLATDVSAAALTVAGANGEALGLRNVEFARGDWFAAVGARTFDLVVANPPYVADDDPHLAQGDVRFEPRTALAAGADGLDAIRAIVQAAPEHIEYGGSLLIEHGYEQGAAVRALLESSGFIEVFTALDLEQRERVSGGRFLG